MNLEKFKENSQEDGCDNRTQKPTVKDTNGELTSEERKEKLKILKNVFLVSFAFFVHFSSYNSMSNLMSSLHKKMGNFSSSMVYAGLIISCTILPTLLLRFLKAKNVISLCFLLYAPYMACLFFPSYYSFLPTALVLGLAASPLWIAKCTYLTKISVRYSQLVREDSAVVVTKFFGIFFVFFQLSQIAGNFLSSAILSQGVENFTRSSEFLEYCGINYCPDFGENITAFTSDGAIDHSKINLISSIYVALAITAALIVLVLVDPLASFINIDVSSLGNQSILSNLLATVSHLKKRSQLLIIPLTMWSGFEQGFLAADYAAGFVTCSIGIHMVGQILIAYGVADAICSYGFSPLIKRVGRVPIFTLGAALNTACLVSFFMWTPDQQQLSVLFVFAILWGVADAIWQTQINAFYGIIFPDTTEGAFSNYRLWESVGFFISYMGGGIWCTSLKSFILLGFLSIGMVGYYVIEGLESCHKRNRI